MRGDIFMFSFYTLFPLHSLSSWSIKCDHYHNHVGTFYMLQRLCKHLFYTLTHHFFIFIILQTGIFRVRSLRMSSDDWMIIGWT